MAETTETYTFQPPQRSVFSAGGKKGKSIKEPIPQKQKRTSLDNLKPVNMGNKTEKRLDK